VESQALKRKKYKQGLSGTFRKALSRDMAALAFGTQDVLLKIPQNTIRGLAQKRMEPLKTGLAKG